jgi:hypothetical protein
VDLENAFDQLQQNVDADPEHVSEARSRRRKFADAFAAEGDVEEVVFIGSIERRTQIEPIKDVDVLIVYSRQVHPEWGQPGASAEAALNHTQQRVVHFFGSDGTVERDFVRLARADNHAVKCFLDDPDDPDAFTVDVVPGLRTADGILEITEKESSAWIATDPETMNQSVAGRQRSWSMFVPLVRVLKRWNADHATGMIPLLIEVMAIDHLLDARRPNALQQYFAAAAANVGPHVRDPAGISAIQPDVDVTAARTALGESADLSWRAVQAEARGETDLAGCLWRKIFGDIFPEPVGGCQDLLAMTPAIGVGAAAVAPRVRRPARDNPQG